MAREIFPCPFCGSEPEVMGSGEGQRGLMIHCIGKDCPNPSVSYYEHEAAIRVWNRRAIVAMPSAVKRARESRQDQQNTVRES